MADCTARLKFGFNLTATEMSPSPAAKRHTKEEEETDLVAEAATCKYIHNCVRKLGIANISGTTNAQGKPQMKFDVIHWT